ncbi:hypothetical protein Cob_v003408 [Colletotrichum orbiculare MAFF 240422]|uniref:Uncharacterized protein n=1 Tax=Colletotrichum orbiculare (strain 104-T / ATCC 96160 / CBS 514.97 / LARS 414 / MAFF 240422) TaxID=1213857 RepID=A0A484G4F1_COLOR|nr:hypothetical protein Cob_v003408 [Colletotrichum orbiculare MAFF 240422]
MFSRRLMSLVFLAHEIASGIREDGRGPFHFFAGSNSVALASESRLKLLIQTGADYNLPVSEKFGSPASTTRRAVCIPWQRS